MKTEFIFGSFNFPRHIVRIMRENKIGKRVDTVYYTSPIPLTGGPHNEHSFYLGDMGSPSRWKYCDDIAHRTIRHKGWYCDENQLDTIRGIVVLLPHGRYLAGWTMGEGMISAVCCDTIYDDELRAALDSDTIAEREAEQAREYYAREEEENGMD